jgi:prepilin-type N-terminal cleavage/methylation domain-containing protein
MEMQSKYSDEGSRWRAGYTLIELMIAVAVMSLVGLAITSTNFHLLNEMSRFSTRSEIDVVRRSLVNLVQASSSWKNTQNNNNRIANCVANWMARPPAPTPVPGCPGPYTGHSWCAAWGPWLPGCSCPVGGPPPTVLPGGCVSSANAANFTLYDGNQVMKVVYDAANPTNGFTSEGEPCGPGAPATIDAVDQTGAYTTRPNPNRGYGFPSNQCPFRFDLKWYSINSNSNSPPVLGITGSLIVDPRYGKGLDPGQYSIGTIYRRTN